MLLQDVGSIFDTDGFRLIMDWIEQESGVAYGSSEAGDEGAPRAQRPRARDDFLIAEGDRARERGTRLRPPAADPPCRRCRPAGSGSRASIASRDRRSSRSARGIRRSSSTQAEIERVVKAEEERFRETLERGLKVFEELAGKESISGDEAFTLAATYGFPLELTVELAEERGQPVDVDDYRAPDDGAP